MKKKIQTILFESRFSAVPGSNVYTDSIHMAIFDIGNQHRKRFYPRDSSPYMDREHIRSPFHTAMIRESQYLVLSYSQVVLPVCS